MKRHIEVLEDGITNSSGVLLASGTVKFFIGGTTTLKTVFKDFNLTIPHPNPLTLDAAGRITAFHDGRTKLVISDSAGALVRTVDNVGTEDSDVAAAAVAIVDGDGLIRVPGTTQLDVNDDNVTINIVSDKVQVKDSGISPTQLATDAVETAKINALAVTTAKINALAVTRAKQEAVGEQISSSSGSFSTTSTSFVDVTNLTVTITTTGRPVMLMLIHDGSASDGNLSCRTDGVAQSSDVFIQFVRGSTSLGSNRLRNADDGSGNIDLDIPLSSMMHLDIIGAGTNTYKVQAKAATGDKIFVLFGKLVAYEL